jgi:hypothetical protein
VAAKSMKAVGAAMMVFGVAQLLFPTAFSQLDMRLHLWIYRRAPAIYSLPGMRHRLEPRLQKVTTILFGLLLLIAGLIVVFSG